MLLGYAVADLVSWSTYREVHMTGFMHVLRDIALLAARLVLGTVMVLHGWQRWQIEGIGRQVEIFTQAGVPSPTIFAWGSTILELAGGLLLVFGLLTPIVAFLFVLEAVLSIVFVSGANGPMLGNQGWEYAAVIAAVSLILTVFGAGRAAVDQLFRRSPDSYSDLEDDDPA